MQKGAIKVSVLYSNEENKSFNMDYYCNKHIPMVRNLLGDAIIDASVEKGLAGGVPGAPAAFIAMGNIYFSSMESFQNAFGPHAATIMGDIPNYTNIKPIIQVSEVMM